jgi:hypothetical protein
MRVFSVPYDDVMSTHPATEWNVASCVNSHLFKKCHVQIHTLTHDAYQRESHVDNASGIAHQGCIATHVTHERCTTCYVIYTTLFLF